MRVCVVRCCGRVTYLEIDGGMKRRRVRREYSRLLVINEKAEVRGDGYLCCWEAVDLEIRSTGRERMLLNIVFTCCVQIANLKSVIIVGQYIGRNVKIIM